MKPTNKSCFGVFFLDTLYCAPVSPSRHMTACLDCPVDPEDCPDPVKITNCPVPLDLQIIAPRETEFKRKCRPRPGDFDVASISAAVKPHVPSEASHPSQVSPSKKCPLVSGTSSIWHHSARNPGRLPVLDRPSVPESPQRPALADRNLGAMPVSGPPEASKPSEVRLDYLAGNADFQSTLREIPEQARAACQARYELAQFRRKHWSQKASEDRGNRRSTFKFPKITIRHCSTKRGFQNRMRQSSRMESLRPSPISVSSPNQTFKQNSACPSAASTPGHASRDVLDRRFTLNPPTPLNLTEDGKERMRDSVTWEVGAKKSKTALKGIRLKGSAKARLRQLTRNRLRQNRLMDEGPMNGSPLTAEQKERLQAVFHNYDEDESGTLSLGELREALADLGYSPRSKTEKQQLSKVLARTVVELEGAGLSPEEFENVVLEMMRFYHDVLAVEISQQMQIRHLTSVFFLRKEDVLDILSDLNLEPRAASDHAVVHECWEQVYKSVEAAVKSAKQKENKVEKVEATTAKRNSYGCQPSKQVSSCTEGLVATMEKTKIRHSGAALAATIESIWNSFFAQVRERVGCLRRARFHKLVDSGEVEEGMVAIFQEELCDLKDGFDMLDKSGSGAIDPEDLLVFLADHGVRPQTKGQHRDVLQVTMDLEGASERQIPFRGVLSLVTCAREMSMAARDAELAELFHFFDKDDSGTLSASECSQMMGRLNLYPRTRSQQSQIAVILESVDADGSGDYSYAEAVLLFQMVQEMLNREYRKLELEVAHSLGMELRRIEELHLVFMTLDTMRVKMLRIEDLRILVDSIRANIPSDQLQRIVDEAVLDGSGVVEFNEFLKFMALIDNYRARVKSGKRPG